MTSLFRRIGGIAVASAAVGALATSAGGAADAATVAHASHPTSRSVVIAPTGPGASVTFTPKRKPGDVGPNPAYGCNLGYPYVTDTFASGKIDWTASISCNITLHMSGYTDLFQWGANWAYANGTSYNNFASTNTSSGAVYGIFSGEWAVDSNIVIDSPAGYTTTPGAGCHWSNTEQTQLTCEITTGPFDATPPPFPG
jgi:hypothetical protein